MKNTSLALLAILSATTAFADGISNLSEGIRTDTFSFIPNKDTLYGSPFTTGPMTYTLNDVSAVFSNSGITDAFPQGYIYTDNGGNIGSLYVDLSSGFTHSSIGNSLSVFHDYSAHTLDPNTTYWFVVGGAFTYNPNLSQVISTSTTIDSASAGWTKANQLEFVGQAIENNINVPFAVNATAVPEVSTYGIAAAAALGGFALIRRRKAA